MPKAILAIRTYPATLLLALLIFLATLLITTGSLGKVRSGGDGGDGGSGMGGTGKSGEFGGSGFGGTGGPSPFFTSTDSEEQQKTPQFSIPSREQAAPVIIAQDPLVEESPSIESPSVLSERIIEAIDSNPLLEATRKEIAQSTEQTEETLETASQSRPALQLVELNNTPEQPVLDSLQRPQPPFQDTESIQESLQALRQVVTAPVEKENAELSQPQRQNDQQFAENIAVKLDTEQQVSEQTRDRDGLPERIQRPDLPPFQRIRPIERPALMPPRVQPMRI
jgi:hypothetical protein